MIPLHKSAKDICEKIILLNNIYSDKSIQDELNINEEQINSLIQKYQEELDIITITTKDIEDSEPKRIDYKTAVLRRADYLFYQMKVEGFKANHACLHMYSLYCKYEFDDIHLIEEEFNYESSLFDRINTQRKRALKHFEHRL